MSGYLLTSSFQSYGVSLSVRDHTRVNILHLNPSELGW